MEEIFRKYIKEIFAQNKVFLGYIRGDVLCSGFLDRLTNKRNSLQQWYDNEKDNGIAREVLDDFSIDVEENLPQCFEEYLIFGIDHPELKHMTDFIMQVYYLNYAECFKDPHYFDFARLDSWFRNNPEKVKEILQKHGIDAVENERVFTVKFEEARKHVKARLPTADSFVSRGEMGWFDTD